MPLACFLLLTSALRASVWWPVLVLFSSNASLQLLSRSGLHLSVPSESSVHHASWGGAILILTNLILNAMTQAAAAACYLQVC